ncbi:MAG: energy transducer TonB [Terriglobia bacterium]
MKIPRLFFLALATSLLVNSAAVVKAAVSAADQQSLQSKYMNKVLFFRNCERMVSQYEVQEDDTVKGNAQPGYWSTDGAAQVKAIEFRKDRVTFKCIKLWANVKNDGQLHYFPASLALKGKAGSYPQTTDIIIHTSPENMKAVEIVVSLRKICLGEDESAMTGAPQSVADFINKVPAQVDINPASGAGFKGTPPKPISNPMPNESVEAGLAGQAGRETFVVYVDEQGAARVVGFMSILQYGLEETTIEAVKGWKFEPASQDGKPVAVRMAMSIVYRLPIKN